MLFKQKMIPVVPLCEVDLTDTKTLQQEDKHCIRILKLITDFYFMKETHMRMMTQEYYITLIEKMVERTKQQWYQKSSSKLYSKKCMTTLVILALVKPIH